MRAWTTYFTGLYTWKSYVVYTHYVCYVLQVDGLFGNVCIVFLLWDYNELQMSSNLPSYVFIYYMYTINVRTYICWQHKNMQSSAELKN